MPADVLRPATRYLLWDSDDRDALFDAHAQVGWVCQLQYVLVGGEVSRTVLLQNNQTRQPPVSVGLDKVIVSDLTNVEALTVADYNQLYPNSLIEPPEGVS